MLPSRKSSNGRSKESKIATYPYSRVHGGRQNTIFVMGQRNNLISIPTKLSMVLELVQLNYLIWIKTSFFFIEHSTFTLQKGRTHRTYDSSKTADISKDGQTQVKREGRLPVTKEAAKTRMWQV